MIMIYEVMKEIQKQNPNMIKSIDYKVMFETQWDCYLKELGMRNQGFFE